MRAVSYGTVVRAVCAANGKGAVGAAQAAEARAATGEALGFRTLGRLLRMKGGGRRWKAVGGQWEVSGRSVGGRWEVRGRSVEGPWEVRGRSVLRATDGRRWKVRRRSMGAVAGSGALVHIFQTQSDAIMMQS